MKRRKPENTGEGYRVEIGTKLYAELYNSWDKLVHYGEYIPYSRPATSYLCKKHGNYRIGSAQEFPDFCIDCKKELEKLDNENKNSKSNI